jgi:hypothetical protein
VALVLGEGKFQIAENEDLFPGSFYIRVGVYSWPLESAISWGALGRVATSYPPLRLFFFLSSSPSRVISCCLRFGDSSHDVPGSLWMGQQR